MAELKELMVSCLIILFANVSGNRGEHAQSCADRIDNKIEVLRKEFSEKLDVLMQENELLKLKISNNEREISDLKGKVIPYVDSNFKNLELDEPGSSVHTNRSRLPGFSRRTYLDKRGSSSVIAFHVFIPQTISHIGLHHTIPFDQEMTDTVNGFNKYTHTYSVPETGVYVFSWTITVKSTLCATELIVNDVIIGLSYPDTDDDTENDTATEIVIKAVNAGDVVFVRSKNGCSSIRSDFIIRSSFSGWKLS